MNGKIYLVADDSDAVNDTILSAAKENGIDIVLVNDIPEEKILTFPYLNKGFEIAEAIGILRPEYDTSLKSKPRTRINQRKFRKYARQNPHSKYNR